MYGVAVLYQKTLITSIKKLRENSSMERQKQQKSLKGSLHLGIKILKLNWIITKLPLYAMYFINMSHSTNKVVICYPTKRSIHFIIHLCLNI